MADVRPKHIRPKLACRHTCLAFDRKAELCRNAALRSGQPVPNQRLTRPELAGQGALASRDIDGSLQWGESHTANLPLFW